MTTKAACFALNRKQYLYYYRKELIMRGNKIMALVWIILALCLTGLLTFKIGASSRGGMGKAHFHLGGNNISFIPGTCPLLETKEFSVSEIDSLDLELSRETIWIQKTNDKKVTVELYCPKEYKPKVQVTGKTLEIESQKLINIMNAKEWKVVVYIPNNMKLKDIDINHASGSNHLEDIQCNSIDLRSASGSVHLTNILGDNVKIASASGSVHFSDCDIDDVEIGVASGSTSIDNINAKKIEIASASGSVKINGKYDSFSIHSNSGSITINDEKAPSDDCEIKSTSGSIKLTIPENSGFVSNYNLTSGNYHNSITKSEGKKGSEIVNGGGPTINFKATSGSIHVYGN